MNVKIAKFCLAQEARAKIKDVGLMFGLCMALPEHLWPE